MQVLACEQNPVFYREMQSRQEIEPGCVLVQDMLTLIWKKAPTYCGGFFYGNLVFLEIC